MDCPLGQLRTWLRPPQMGNSYHQCCKGKGHQRNLDVQCARECLPDAIRGPGLGWERLPVLGILAGVRGRGRGAKRGPSPQVHQAGSDVPHPGHLGTEAAQEQGKQVICSRCRACRSQSSRWKGILPPTQTALSRGRPRDQGQPHLCHQADDRPWGSLALLRQ